MRRVTVTIFKTVHFPVFVFMLTWMLVSVFLQDDVHAFYNAKYLESAHGSSSTGVKRKAGSVTENYSAGNCGHCHEQHASFDGVSTTPNEYGLFAPGNPASQTDNFCFQCHKGVGSMQDGGLTNYTYSKNFGGGTATLTTIYDAFNPATGSTPSSHNLSDVLTHAVGRGIGFTSNTNACVVCHDPHYAQDNTPVTLTGRGGAQTTIRRPLDFTGEPLNLWGDDDATGGYNERMLDYTAKYQAPYYMGSATYEPANNATTNGSNLPGMVNFCINNCHTTATVYSTERGGNLIQLDWTATGDQHGKNHSSGGQGTTKAPYGNDAQDYVLACTDCHEPHGSQNQWLLRTTVNGMDGISIPGAGQWLNFCTACHTITQHTAPWNSTTDCNNGGVCHDHGGGLF